MKLSILIPSNKPNELAKFLNSLEDNTNYKSDIQIVVLIDDKLNYVEYNSSKFITVHRVPDEVLNISELQYECYKASDGDWIMLCNDDCLIETLNWDDQVRAAIDNFPDELALIYPNDGMFGQNLACFPIISRRMIEMTNLFPMPYRRYKVDDTIFSIFPPERRIYMPSCKFTHFNDRGISGYKLSDGRIYPIDTVAAEHDGEIWKKEQSKRDEMKKTINNSLGIKSTPKVLIGVSTAEMARRAVFYDYFNILDKPMGTILTLSHGQSPAKSRNLIIEQALANDCTHVLFLDDDTAFQPDTLNKLLAHDKDIVTAFYVMRNYPHKPLIFNYRDDNGACRHYYPVDDDKGLIEVVNCGLGCVLIKTDVFRSMNPPWVTLGELTKDDWCDDISFFNRVQAKGYKIYCDLDCLVGHMASLIVWPMRTNDKWFTSYDTTGDSQVSFPMPRP